MRVVDANKYAWQSTWCYHRISTASILRTGEADEWDWPEETSGGYLSHLRIARPGSVQGSIEPPIGRTNSGREYGGTKYRRTSLKTFSCSNLKINW